MFVDGKPTKNKQLYMGARKIVAGDIKTPSGVQKRISHAYQLTEKLCLNRIQGR
jgi:hypothetical protein